MELDLVAFLAPLVMWVGVAALVSIGLGVIRWLLASALDDEVGDGRDL